MDKPVIKFRLDIAALWAAYFNDLQHLIDEATLLVAATKSIQEHQLAPLAPFATIHPASHARKSFEQNRASAEERVLRAFLRDSTEVTGSFLDHCIAACTLLELARKGKCSGSEVNQLLVDLPKKHHKLHLPQKLDLLEKRFGVASGLCPHVLSINRARACVVHRHGLVTSLDVDESDTLRVRWRTTEVTAVGVDSGKKFLLDKPVTLEEECEIQIQFTEYERVFAIGETIALTPKETHSTIITLYQFGVELTQSIENFAQRIGLSILDRKSFLASAGHFEKAD